MHKFFLAAAAALFIATSAAYAAPSHFTHKARAVRLSVDKTAHGFGAHHTPPTAKSFTGKVMTKGQAKKAHGFASLPNLLHKSKHFKTPR